MEIINGQITIFGGNYDGKDRSEVEAFDPESLEWVLVGEMLTPRDQFAAVKLSCKTPHA
jgi:hypothetical protein